MTDETLAEILSGGHDPTGRADLHAMLDHLLDAADADGGQLDGPAFWGFVAAFGRGRGITDDITGAAVRHIEAVGGPVRDWKENPAEAMDAARMAQWAMLSALLRRVTAFPDEIVPRELQAAWFIAAADNIVAGHGKLRSGEHMDLLGLGTQRRTAGKAISRAARRRLVGAVFYEAERSKRPLETVVSAMLDDLPLRTWQDWVRGSAKAQRIPPDEVATAPRSAAKGEGDPNTYQLDDETLRELLELARTENPWHPGF